MKNRFLIRFLMVMSLISISMSLSQYRHRKRRLAGRLTHRQRRQELSQNVPMDWIEEAPYSEEEGVGNALDKIDEHPNLPPAPEVPVEPHEPELPPQKDRQRAPDDPEAQGRSNDDYMDDLMKDMGIPPEGATPPPDYDDDAPPVHDGAAPAMSRQDLDFSRLVEICDEPVAIASGNRYTNTTIRLFRNNDYWDLMGLPDRQAFVSKKQKLSPPLGPVGAKTSIVTILTGPMKDMTYKFSKSAFWAWNDTTGQQVSGGRGGEFWMELPEDAKDGFDTMFHNGDDTNPMIIAFKGEKVWYISTNKNSFEFIGDEKGYADGGRNKENWPKGVMAAFTYPLADYTAVYLFREDKHCVRSLTPLKSGKDCDEWRENGELFGCRKNFEGGDKETPKPVVRPDTSVNSKPEPEQPKPKPPNEEPREKPEEPVTEAEEKKSDSCTVDMSAGLVVLLSICSLLFTNI